jgi:hypothetical protein
VSVTAKGDQQCGCCLDTIAKGKEMYWDRGWLHPWCPSSGTYLAGIEDSEGHPMALRVPFGVKPKSQPQCRHKHSRLCTHSEWTSGNADQRVMRW